MKRILFALFLLTFISVSLYAQEFEIKKYDVHAKINLAARSFEVTTKLRLVNFLPPDLADRILLSPNNKPRLTFFLNDKAKLGALTVNGAAVTPKTADDPRNKTLRVSIDITTTIAELREMDVEMTYTLPSSERGSSSHVSTSESFLLPASFWVPVVHTPYIEHGADTAPMSLTVALPEGAPKGLKVVSSGQRKSDTSFEQPLAAQPFFFVGDYDVTVRGGATLPVEVYAQRGLSEAGKAQVQRVAAEAEKILSFYAKYFDVPVATPFRIIASQARGLGAASTQDFGQARDVAFSTVGALSVDDSLFRLDAVDLGTIELMAQAAARQWIDGQVLLRGRGVGLLRDALPIYVTAQYLGERFGAAQKEAAFERYRRAYAAVARSDAPLLLTSLLDRSYTTSMYNKGALVWRIFEMQLGKQPFETTIRAMLNRQRVDVLSLNDWTVRANERTNAVAPAPLCSQSRCASMRNLMIASGAPRQVVNDLFDNWIDNYYLPDFVVGQPQATANGVESTIANFGNGDFPVDIVAVTEDGQTLKQTLTLKAGEYGAVTYPAGTKIKSIEADPARLFIQKDYTNDTFPRRVTAADNFALANVAFSKNDFATAEAKAREALAVESNAATLQSLLGRALIAQKKNAEAKQVFTAVLKNEAVPIQAYGYAHLGLGDIGLAENNFAEAATHYRLAAFADIDVGNTLVAREGLLKAERGGNALKLPEEVRAFWKNFDNAIVSGTSEQVGALLELGNLRAFSQRLVINKPQAWTTELLRSEEWDANQIGVDALLSLRLEGKQYAGRALFVMNRISGKLLLSEVPIFDLKVTGGAQ
jgi:hypothetical protein